MLRAKETFAAASGRFVNEGDLIRVLVSGDKWEIRQDENEGRTLVGYAAVFNSPTEIDSWEGRFVETIVKGAFRKTIKENRDAIKVLFNHGYDPQIGDKPLGKPTVMREDDIGLYVEVPLSRTSYNEDLIALLSDGALDGMSFRFKVVREEWNEPEEGLPERTIKEIQLFEFGPVTFPAYQATNAGVRSREDFSKWLGLTPEQREKVLAIVSTSEDAADGSTDAPHEHPSGRDLGTYLTKVRIGPYILSTFGGRT